MEVISAVVEALQNQVKLQVLKLHIFYYRTINFLLPGNNTIPLDDPEIRALQIVTIFILSSTVHNTHQWSLVNYISDNFLLLYITRMNESKFKLRARARTHTHHTHYRPTFRRYYKKSSASSKPH